MKRRKASNQTHSEPNVRQSRTSVVLPEVPGQELEKATADVTRDAGKSLIRGLEAIFGAKFAVWIAENMAKAEVARRAIETQGAVEERRVLTRERRRFELDEIKHQEAKALAERRLERLFVEMGREQANFEAVTARSLTLIEHDADGDKPREVDVDWMFKFARYAQDVSDKDVQELWARILTSAAIEGRQLLSAAALQAMSLMDKRAAKDFEKFCCVLATFRFYPLHERGYQSESQDINLQTLRELGLIEERDLKGYSFPEFDMKLGELGGIFDMPLSQMCLTQRGIEIAKALFVRRTDMLLNDELVMKYLKDVVSTYADKYAVNIFPKINGNQAPYVIPLKKRSGATLPGFESFDPDDEELPDQLRRLIKWAAENYMLSRVPNPSYQRS
jgi:Protein of unknown function (DUF2806)